MIPCQRHLFEIPDDVTYFDVAYVAPLLRSVRAAGEKGIAKKSSPWRIHLADFFEEAEHARELFARLIGATADDVAIIPAVSYGIQTAASNVAVRRGQTIVLLTDQFPSNVYGWKELARERGASVVTIPRPPDWNWTDALVSAIDQRTAVVAVPNCHWMDGSLVDLVQVGARCRDVGAALVVDATQSLGAWPLDVSEVRPDFLVAATYKWLLGPYSMGFLYAAPQHHLGRPLEHSPFARAHSHEEQEWYSGALRYRDDYQPGARRFDVGERANFALMPMAIAALEQILEWQVSHIAETLSSVTGRIASFARERGLKTPRDDNRLGHMVGFRLPQGSVAGLQDRLQRQNVYISTRAESVRISPHLYNSEADLDRLFSVLKNLAG